MACACGSPTSCVHTRARMFVRGCVCTGPVAAPVKACAGWGLACPGLARRPAPLPRVPGARCGRAGPETSPSCCAQFQGSHPLACCPQSSPALAPVPWASRKALGGPASSPAQQGPPPRQTQWRGCGAHFLPQLQSPLQSEPGEKRAESVGEATRGVRWGPSGFCSLGAGGVSAQR